MHCLVRREGLRLTQQWRFGGTERRDTNLMIMAAIMMMGVRPIVIRRDMVAVALGVGGQFAGRCFNTVRAFRCMCERSHPDRQDQCETRKQG